MPTALTFAATNPDGSSVTLRPMEYRADWPHMGHQRLSFQCFGGQGIDERATIKVTRPGETMPVFCGWFDGIKRPSFKSKKPQEYHCLGHSAILSHEGLEWNFVNRSDGDQELRCDLQLYNGWYSDPVKSYVEADLIDFEVGTLDAANYGFDSVVMMGRDSTFGYSFWPPARWGRDSYPTAGVWKEHVTSDISMSYDFVRVTITSPPYDGQYDMRILKKAFESALNSDVMEEKWTFFWRTIPPIPWPFPETFPGSIAEGRG